VGLFWLCTKRQLDDVMTPGFFDSVSDLRFRKEDQIEVVASIDSDGPAPHATMAVNKSGGQISQLHLYR
jgi:hypothetical protein